MIRGEPVEVVTGSRLATIVEISVIALIFNEKPQDKKIIGP